MKRTNEIRKAIMAITTIAEYEQMVEYISYRFDPMVAVDMVDEYCPKAVRDMVLKN